MSCEDEGKFTLVNLPWCPLQLVLSHTDATALFMLSQTCLYLKQCVKDPTFWKYVDARQSPHTDEKYKYIMERIHEKTSHYFAGGGRVPKNFFQKIENYEHLKILSLENQNMTGIKISIKEFPNRLEELSLKNTKLSSQTSSTFFQYSFPNMRNLRVLILDECTWLTSNFLLSVSKYENLEIISVVKCPRVHLQTLPYLTVAKYGCSKLKIFDCRFTGIGGELLRNFFPSESIQRLYFQSFNSTQIDYNVDYVSISKKFVPATEINTDITITDSNLANYTLVISKYPIEKIWDSILYEDPYPECSCGYKNLQEERLVPNVDIPDDDTICFLTRDLEKIVCRKHRKDIEQLNADVRRIVTSCQNFIYPDNMSDNRSDSDSSSSDVDCNCCIFGMGSKMILSCPPFTPSSITLPLVRIECMDTLLRQNRRVATTLRRKLNNDRPEENSDDSDSYDENDSSNVVGPINCNKRSHDDTQQAPTKKMKIRASSSESDSPPPNDWIKIDSINNRSAREDSDEDVEPVKPVEPKPSTSKASNDPNDENNNSDSSNSLSQSNLKLFVPLRRSKSNIVVRAIVAEEEIKPQKVSLQRLSLRGYKRISDLTLSYLKHLDLELLDLTYTSVTKKGIEDFLTLNPNCRIIHPLYCVCKPKSPF